MSKSKLSNNSKFSDKLLLSTKIDSNERLKETSSGTKFASPKSAISIGKQKERFQYSCDEKLYKTLIKITSITPLNSSLKSPEILSPTSNKLFNKTLGNNPSSAENQHHRYKRSFVYKDLDKYRSLSEAPIGDLQEKVSKYIQDNVTRDDFYKTLIKNKIDPESKKVSQILQEFDKSGTETTGKIIDKLAKIRDISTTYDKMEDKIKSVPKNQVLTSFDPKSKQKIKRCVSSQSERTTKLDQKKSSIPKSNMEDTNISNEEIEDNFGMQNSCKRRFDKEKDSIGGKHHNDSEKIISHEIHSKNTARIKGITIEKLQNKIGKKAPLNELICSNEKLSHKEKKIAFIQSSISLNVEEEPLDNSKLTDKKYGTVMQNFSSKDTFSFFDSRHRKNKQDAKIISEHKLARPMKYKNIISEENINAVSKEKKKQLILDKSSNGKILGMCGKGKAELSNSEVNQSKSTYNKLFEWKVKKTKHEIPISSPKNSIIENEVSDVKNMKSSRISKTKCYGLTASSDMKNKLNDPLTNPSKNNMDKVDEVKSFRTRTNKGFLSLFKS